MTLNASINSFSFESDADEEIPDDDSSRLSFIDNKQDKIAVKHKN